MSDTTASISLDGQWQFELDPSDRGLAEHWFLRSLTDTAKLPGTTDQNGKGTQQTDDPELWGGLTRTWIYEGQAWYQRSISIPANWTGQCIRLFLERCHWSTRVWINEVEIGSDRSLSTPHVYDVTAHASPGDHRLTILVDNRLLVDIGPYSHSITEHSQTNWNGIVGRIELQAHAALWIEKICAVPDYVRKLLRVSGLIRNRTGGCGSSQLTVRLCQRNKKRSWCQTVQAIDAVADSTAFSLELDLSQSEIERWDEWTQGRYEIEVGVRASGQLEPFTTRVPFGWRDLRVSDKRLRINDRWLLLRGTLECCVFPLTGHPPMTLGPWRRIFRLLRDHGLNHVRFHSWCPPEAAFIAADELGLLLQPELPGWAWCRPGSALSDYIMFEGQRVLDTYGHHPSFAFFALGNEMPGDCEHLDALTDQIRTYDCRRRLLTSHAGCRVPLSQMDFFVNSNVGLHTVRISGRYNETGQTSSKPAAWTPGDHRGNAISNQAGRHSGEGTSRDYREAVAECPVPLVVHELGQWVVHPDFSEIRRYTGVLKPLNLIQFRKRLRLHGLGGLLRQFQKATGHLAWKCFYKEDIEIIHRTAGMGGYQLLQMNDFPGQGEALTGAFDVFWNNKDIFSAKEYRGFAGPTVPLLALPRFVWRANETLSGDVSVAHYGAADLPNATVRWSVREEKTQTELASGLWQACHLRQGEVTVIGKIELSLAKFPSPASLIIRVSLENGQDCIENQWNFWLYPVEIAAQPRDQIVIATRADKDVRSALAAGRSVLLTLTDLRAADYQNLLRAVFSPVFWSIRNIPTVHPGTMGLLVDPAHPAFAGFPTGEAADFQWMELINGAIAFNLRQQSRGLKPLIRCIDDFHRGNPMAYMLEAKVGRGRLLLSGCDLVQDLDRRLAACRMRNCLLQYMASSAFDPRQKLDLDLLFAPRGMRYAKVLSASAEKPGFEAWRILDADWYSGWETPESGPDYPHHVIIDLGLMARFQGVRYVPFQQKPMERTGVIREFAIFASKQLENWGEPIITRRLAHSNRLVHDFWLKRPIDARYLKFVALSAFRGARHAALGELELLEFEHLADSSDKPAEIHYAEAAPVDNDRFVVYQ
ncbi:MAG: sugar-binding domain-containing protein [bacterium]